MDNKKLFDELSEIVCEMASKAPEENTNMIYDLGFDSVAMIELFSRVEDKYQVEFDFGIMDFDDIAIFGNFVKYVNSVLG